MLSKQSVSRASVMLSAFAVGGGLLGCLRESLVAFFFGPGAALDAYLAAFMIPTVATNLLNATVPFVFIHLLDQVRAEAGEGAAWRFAVRFLARMVWVLAGLTVACVWLWKPILGLAAMGFGQDQLLAARHYLRILAPSIMLSGIFIYSTAILHSWKHFFWPALTAMTANFFILGAMLIGGRTWGLASLGAGFVAGTVFQCGVLLAVLWRERVKGTAAAKAPPRGIGREDWRHFIFPVVLLFALDQGIFIATRSLASFLEKGSISILYFANTILQLVQMVVTIPILRALYPYLHDLESVRARLLPTLRMYLLITVPAALGIALLSERIVQLLFQRGAFATHYTQTTGHVLLVYILSLIPVGLGNVLLIILFRRRKIWHGVMAAAAALAIAWGLGRLLMVPFGVMGIALAVLVAAFANFGILLHFFRRHVFAIAWQEVRGYLTKVAGLAGAMGLITVLLDAAWNQGPWLAAWPSPVKLSAIVSASAVFYMGMGYWFKMNEIVYLVEKFKQALRR